MGNYLYAIATDGKVTKNIRGGEIKWHYEIKLSSLDKYGTGTLSTEDEATLYEETKTRITNSRKILDDQMHLNWQRAYREHSYYEAVKTYLDLLSDLRELGLTASISIY